MNLKNFVKSLIKKWPLTSASIIVAPIFYYIASDFAVGTEESYIFFFIFYGPMLLYVSVSLIGGLLTPICYGFILDWLGHKGKGKIAYLMLLFLMFLSIALTLFLYMENYERSNVISDIKQDCLEQTIIGLDIYIGWLVFIGIISFSRTPSEFWEHNT